MPAGNIFTYDFDERHSMVRQKRNVMKLLCLKNVSLD